MATTAPLQPSITERSALGLARSIRSGELRARDVVEAHIDVLERAQRRINAIAMARFEDARTEADAIDAVIAAGAGRELPPLAGVPCTIKESIAVRGMPNCAGVVARRDLRSIETAPAAQRLLDAGTILLGVTNTAELCAWVESENRVYGRTSNAYDPQRIAGGSSGGEGAAVGCGGSPIGLGADSGGSIRIPAFFNGVFGHRPSPGLVPSAGTFPSDQKDPFLTIGPLARRAEDLMPLLRIMSGTDRRASSPEQAKLETPPDVSLDHLPVVISDDSELVPVSRELHLARERAADALVTAGAKIEHQSMRSMRRAFGLYLTALSEGTPSVRELLLAEGAVSPSWRTSLRPGGPHTVATRLLLAAETLDAHLPSRATRRVLAAGRALAAEVEATVGTGVMLHPPHGRVAPRHGRTVGRPWALNPTAAFSLAGLAVTQVPLGLNTRGLPLGVQVAAGPNRDHIAIAVALELERALGGWVPPND